MSRYFILCVSTGNSTRCRSYSGDLNGPALRAPSGCPGVHPTSSISLIPPFIPSNGNCVNKDFPVSFFCLISVKRSVYPPVGVFIFRIASFAGSRHNPAPLVRCQSFPKGGITSVSASARSRIVPDKHDGPFPVQYASRYRRPSVGGRVFRGGCGVFCAGVYVVADAGAVAGADVGPVPESDAGPLLSPFRDVGDRGRRG